jgi:beta-galactosidase
MNEHTSYWGWPNLTQSWSWEGHEGEALDVSVYTNYDEVRLELNGKEIGTQKVSESTMLTAKFEVPYDSGELVAIGMNDGEEQERKSIKTVGAPYQLRVTPERNTVAADIGELAYFNVEVLDESGLLIPHAEVSVEFNIQGKCKLQAVGNGNPTDMHSFQQPKITTFKGRCQLIVRSCEGGNEIVVTAKSGDLKFGEGRVKLIKL